MAKYRIVWSLRLGYVNAPLNQYDSNICATIDAMYERSLQRERDPDLTARDLHQHELGRRYYPPRGKAG